METSDLIEWFGYFASLLIATSFMMKSINKLRFINTIGAICFVIYGIAIKAFPVALINFFVVGVNIYYLIQERTGK